MNQKGPLLTIIHFGGVLFPMIIRFLRIFAFLMCAFTTGIVDAHTLHVGNKTFALSQIKYTTPSLACKISDETWYGTLITAPLTDTLHIKYDDTTYSLCEPFTDTVNYTYDNDGRLISADENLWLKVPPQQTPNKVVIYSKIHPGPNIKTQMGIKLLRYAGTMLYGNYIAENNSYRFFSTSNGTMYFDLAGARISANNQFLINQYYEFEIGNHYVLNLNTGYRLSGTPRTNFQQSLMDTNLAIIGGDSSHSTFELHYLKIWDNGTLVRDMVPVPACMKIGNFVVPENGMWDIVEQKFYGNANSTGTIIYGRDE